MLSPTTLVSTSVQRATIYQMIVMCVLVGSHGRVETGKPGWPDDCLYGFTDIFYRFLTLIDFISSIFRLFVVVSCDNLSRLLSWRSVSYSYRVRCVPPTNDATLPRSLPTEWRLQFPRTSTSMSDSSTLVSRRYDGFVDRLNSVDRQGVPAPQGLGDVACRINNNIPRRRVWCRLLYCPSHRLPPSCCQSARVCV